MRPIVSIVGKSDSGKTTLLKSLIAELKRRGYRVAVIKHAAENFELDTEGKDSWRLGQAGSVVFVISSPHQLALLKNLDGDLTPQEIAHFIGWDYDLILTEGFKQSHYPKIEVHRREQGKELLSPPQQLLAVVTDEPLKVNVPQFAKDEVSKIADLIEQTVLQQNQENEVDLLINETPIPLNQALQNLLLRTLVALVSGIRGFHGLKSLRLVLRRKS